MTGWQRRTIDNRCAVTGEKTLPVLDAAHILPYSKGGSHDVRNGLLLRRDIHSLFDRRLRYGYAKLSVLRSANGLSRIMATGRYITSCKIS